MRSNALSQNNRNNNHIRVPSFILSGAPFFHHSGTKLGTRSVGFGRIAVIRRPRRDGHGAAALSESPLI